MLRTIKNMTSHSGQPSMCFYLSDYAVWLSWTGGQMLMSRPVTFSLKDTFKTMQLPFNGRSPSRHHYNSNIYNTNENWVQRDNWFLTDLGLDQGRWSPHYMVKITSSSWYQWLMFVGAKMQWSIAMVTTEHQIRARKQDTDIYRF